MQYRDDPKSHNPLSILGLGCMRFPRGLTSIDEKASEQLVLAAIEGGINYFDTAYIYGGSEEVVGRILAKNQLRSTINLATKLPISNCKTPEDFDRFFAIQLERLQTTWIDYYLMHNVSSVAQWERLCDLGIEDWLVRKQQEGAIKRVGFSFHGAQDQFLALLDVRDWDFCQIQYNYVNTNYQAGAAGLKKAADKNMPVIIMEPLLGGKLATGLPRKAQALLHEVDPTSTPAAQALRWLWNQPETTVVLSGMSSMAQLAENLAVARDAVPGILTASDLKAFNNVVAAFEESYRVPCTGCNYCMPCPNKVNIPACFAAYNMSYTVGLVSGLQLYLTSVGMGDPAKNTGPGRCIKCGKCEQHCPQHIPVITSLESVKKRLEPFWLRAALAVYMKLRG
ncbi:MAG: aldo/keto reductase [Coriobacteriales bacterium]|jgi:predicted aldo/keto reductase-like oxidoreductase|nr:aldo/keto reductase [Coriobacteriales bacterium]